MNQHPIFPTTGGSSPPVQAFFMPFSAGEIIAGKYQIIELIGAGAMGYVVCARRIELGDKVALKLLRPEMLPYEDLVARFTQEARTAVMIKSEHIVRVFDVGSLPGHGPFIAMEFLEGHDLRRVLDEHGSLPAALAAEYMLQVCEALATAHASGIVHRDIKPENLFLTKPVQGMDIVKVLDFGVSKLILKEVAFERRHAFITTMSSVGSPAYMSPEQVRASKEVDARADIWSLGCVLYELLTGSPAFDALSLTELASKVLEQDSAPVRTRWFDVSPAAVEPDPNLWFNVARCYQVLGDSATAIEKYEAYLRSPNIDPSGRERAEKSLKMLRESGERRSATATRPMVTLPSTDSSSPSGRDKVESTELDADRAPRERADERNAGADGTRAAVAWVVTAVLATGTAVTGILAYDNAKQLAQARVTFPGDPLQIDHLTSNTAVLSVTADALGGSRR